MEKKNQLLFSKYLTNIVAPLGFIITACVLKILIFIKIYFICTFVSVELLLHFAFWNWKLCDIFFAKVFFKTMSNCQGNQNPVQTATVTVPVPFRMHYFWHKILVRPRAYLFFVFFPRRYLKTCSPIMPRKVSSYVWTRKRIELAVLLRRKCESQSPSFYQKRVVHQWRHTYLDIFDLLSTSLLSHFLETRIM